MKRISVYLLYGITIMTAVMCYDFYKTDTAIRHSYREHFASKSDRLNDIALVFRSYYVARPDAEELAEFLESRRRLYDISFWALYKNGVIENTSIDSKELKFFDFNFSKPGTEVWFSPKARDYSYATENFGDGRQLVVGIRYAENEFVRAEFVLQKEALIDYVAGLLLICFAVFAFFFRDITKTIRELSRGGRRSYRSIGANSKEADMLVRGLASYDDKQSELKREKELFIWQVLPSLRTELMSGRAPPYDFGCTLVRTDINNFSKIYNEHPVEEFASTINDFFTDASHIIARYGGLVHEFVGDEVIYYFKDEHAGDSVAAALAAIRDINDSASAFNKFTLENRGYPFTVKSSLARGKLRFGRFVNGYGLAGPILIETVRILSHVHEKDGNVIIFDERHLESAQMVSRAEPYMKVKLKGFPEEKSLYSYLGHKSVGELLQRFESGEGKASLEALELIRFFRSDEDICAVIAWARIQNPEEDSQQLLRIIGSLRQVSVTKSNGVPQQLLLLWIDEQIRSIENDSAPAEGKYRVLSSALRLMESLVPPSEFTHQFEAALRRALELRDRRVIANALDALTLFRREYEPTMAERLSQHLDNRVAANALVHEGVRAISPFIVKRLTKMIGSRNVANVASALYAIGEIAAHHRALDPVYYGTQTGFVRLTHKISDYVLHQDARIRRQALIAARKCAEPSVIEAIWSKAAHNDVLLKEVREHLDPQAQPPATRAQDAA